QGDAQLLEALGGEGDADEAPGVRDHEVDVPRLDLFRGHHQVALVLPVLVVHHDDHPALPDLLDGLFDAVEQRLVHREAPSRPPAGKSTNPERWSALQRSRRSPVPRSFSTYFPIRSASRLTRSPGRSWPRVVTCRV